MISKPTTRQLIETACSELTTRVAPALINGADRVVLEMAVAVLSGAAVCCANELAWMQEEADAIEGVATRTVAELPAATSLAAALRAYADAKTDSRYLAEAQANYARASEVLSCLAEAAFADGDPIRLAFVKVLFDQRMANENAVTGQFLAIGRT
jgi:hypothetical protein